MTTHDEIKAIHQRLNSLSMRLWGIYGLLAAGFVALWSRIGGAQ